MDGICNLLKPVLDSEHDDRISTLKNLLSSCADQRAFSQEVLGIPSFVRAINGRLNVPSSRIEGLLLLKTFLPQCSQDILSQNGSTWIQFCLKGTALPKTAQLSFTLLKMLIELSGTVPGLSKYVSSVTVASFAEQIHQGIIPEAYLYALECLEQFMKIFNGPCGPHRKVIERFLLSMVDYSGPLRFKVYWQAARCVALLPQIGGGREGGAQYKLAWAAQQKSVCRTIHIILDNLYADTNELQVNLMGGMLEGLEPLQLAQIDEADPVLRTQKLVARLNAVSACLQAMLVMAFPVPKNVSVSSIMNLICRGLAVNGSSLGTSHTTHSLALLADLPKIHFALLKLLESLILLGRTNLLPYAGLICRLCIQTLKWTKVDDWPYGTERPYGCLRIQAYDVLKMWCGVAKAGSLIEDVSQQFADLALQDIYSEKDRVSLSASLTKKNNQRRAARKVGAASPGMVFGAGMSRDLSVLDCTANKDVCIAALQAVTTMVMSASFKLQASLHKTLQETVVTILLKTRGRSPVPYTETGPRLELYRLLLQLVLDGHTVWPAPTNIALRLFSYGLHDADAQISEFCGMAQSSIEKIIHPAYPSINLPPDQKELEAYVEDKLSNSEVPSIVISSHNNADEEIIEENIEHCDQELTDALSMLPKSVEERQSNKSNAISSTRAISSEGYSLRSGLKTISPIKNDKKTKENSISQQIEDLEITLKTDSPSKVNNQLKKIKLSPASVEKIVADSNTDEGGHSENDRRDARRTIDLTTSDLSDDDDIAEMPCEIDLADSEDEKSGVSICSQDTVNTPLTEKEKRLEKTIVETPQENDAKSKSSVPDMETSLSVETDVPAENSVAVSSNPVDSPTRTALEPTVVSESGKRAAEEEEEESASKKQKVTDDDLEFASDEDSMLLAFVDVTRDEEDDQSE